MGCAIREGGTLFIYVRSNCCSDDGERLPCSPTTKVPRFFQIYKCFATADETAAFRKMFLDGGMGYGTAKTMLFEKIDSVLAKPREKYDYLMSHLDEIEKVLQDGAKIAQSIAAKTLAKVKKKMLG